jgi:hypothetical protein
MGKSFIKNRHFPLDKQYGCYPLFACLKTGKGYQRGEFLPFVSDPERSLTRRVKGGKEGFSFRCLYHYGLTSKPLLLSHKIHPTATLAIADFMQKLKSPRN